MALLSLCATIYVAVHVLATFGGRLASIIRRRLPAPRSLPELGVSFLKPLCGIDPDLDENLERFVALVSKQPTEILLLIEEEGDAASPIAEAFARRHPENIRILYGHQSNASNAKVAALMRATPEARYPLLWVTDSNARVSQPHFDSLLATWNALQSNGRIPTLVHAPIAADGDTSLGSRFERLHLTSQINWGREVGRFGGAQPMGGKSFLIHRDDLAAIGGFEAFKDSAAEDFKMAQTMCRIGVMGYARVASVMWFGRNHPVSAFLKRQFRWARIRANQIPIIYFGFEHFSYFMIPALLTIAGYFPWPVLLGVLAGHMALDAAMEKTHLGHVDIGDILFFPLKELLVFAVYLRGFWRGTVDWRGRKLEIVPGAKFVPKSRS